MKSARYLIGPKLSQALYNSRAFNGGKNVLVNGCFDLLHVGHVELIEWGKEKIPDCTLVVALNSDDSIARNKGPGRPIVPLQERVRIISALRGVDIVTVFEEDTPLTLIATCPFNYMLRGGKDCGVQETICDEKTLPSSADPVPA